MASAPRIERVRGALRAAQGEGKQRISGALVLRRIAGRAGAGSLLLAGGGAVWAALAPAAALLASIAVIAGGMGILASVAIGRIARSAARTGAEQVANSRQAEALLIREHASDRLPEELRGLFPSRSADTVRQHFSSWQPDDLEKWTVQRVEVADRDASRIFTARASRSGFGLAATAVSGLAVSAGVLASAPIGVALGAVGAGAAITSAVSARTSRRSSALNAHAWGDVKLLCSEISVRREEDAHVRSAAAGTPSVPEAPRTPPASLASRALSTGAGIARDFLRNTPSSQSSAVRTAARAAGSALVARRRARTTPAARAQKGRR